MTVARVTAANSPYPIQASDDLVLFLGGTVTSAGTNNALGAPMESTPAVGKKLTAVWQTSQSGGSPPPWLALPPQSIAAGIEDPSNPGSFPSKVNLSVLQNRASWEFDGVNWTLLPGS